jgi:hypothetical protein
VSRFTRLFQLAVIFLSAHALFGAYMISTRAGHWSPEEYLLGYGIAMGVALCIAGWPLYLVAVLHGPLEELRVKYGGKLRRAGIVFPFPCLQYEVGRITATFEARVEAFRHQQAMLVCRYVLSSSEGAARPGPVGLSVFPETLVHSLMKLFGMQDLRIGHPDFDQKLVVQSAPVERFNPLLAEGLREQLVRLYRMSPSLHGFRVSYSDGQLVLQRSLELSRYAPWATEVVRTIDSIAWNLMDTLSPDRISAFAGAVEIVEVAPNAGAPSICLVCAQKIEEPKMMACTACDTPHHKDCWEYNARCALFGCGGERAREVVTPAVAPPAAPAPATTVVGAAPIAAGPPPEPPSGTDSGAS